MGKSRFFQCHESGLAVQVFQHNRPITYPEHRHSEMALVICTEGTVESTQFHTRDVLYEDQVLFTNIAVPHASRYCIDGKRTHGVTLEFSAAVLKRLGYSGSSRYMDSRFLGKMHLPEAGRLARRIAEEAARDDLDTVFMVTALARQIVAYVLREWPRSLVVAAPALRMAHLPRRELVRSIEIMNATAARDFSVPGLARQINRSPSAFTRLFSRSVGTSPHLFYRGVLLQRAAGLLSSSDQPVKEIAFDLGFNSLSHFSNSFRSYWNVTPSDYRNVRTSLQAQPSYSGEPVHSS